MGMTIDEIIQSLTTMKSVVGVNQLIINETIEKMQKYQKIEGIVDAYITDNPREPMYDTEDYMQSIREILEDGNVNG